MSEWQPIETAPKDHFPRLYRSGSFALQGFVDAAGRLLVQNEFGQTRKMRLKPTHWAPLPELPKVTA